MDKLMELVMDMGRLWDAFWMQYLVGMRNTLILAVAATLIGCVIGFACGVLNTIPYTKQDNAVKRFFLKLVRVVVRVYVEVFRGTPMVLQAVFIFYGLPYFTDQALQFRGYMGMWAASLIIVSINTGAYAAETIRAAILAVPKGQMEAGYCAGMTYPRIMTRIILPQAARTAFPPLSNSLIGLVKDTSLASNITIMEMFMSAQRIAARTYDSFALYCEVALIYLLFCTVLTKVQRICEKKLELK